MLPGAHRARTGAGKPCQRRRRGRGRILRGNGSRALGVLSRLRRPLSGDSPIPQRTETAVANQGLLADLFAVVEEFDSTPGEDGAANGRLEGNGGLAVSPATIDRSALT